MALHRQLDVDRLLRIPKIALVTLGHIPYKSPLTNCLPNATPAHEGVCLTLFDLYMHPIYYMT